MSHLMTVGTYSRGTCSSPLPKTIICRAFWWILYWNDLRPSKSEQWGFTGILVLLKIFMVFNLGAPHSPGFIWPQKKRIQIHSASEIQLSFRIGLGRTWQNMAPTGVCNLHQETPPGGTHGLCIWQGLVVVLLVGPCVNHWIIFQDPPWSTKAAQIFSSELRLTHLKNIRESGSFPVSHHHLVFRCVFLFLCGVWRLFWGDSFTIFRVIQSNTHALGGYITGFQPTINTRPPYLPYFHTFSKARAGKGRDSLQGFPTFFKKHTLEIWKSTS